MLDSQGPAFTELFDLKRDMNKLANLLHVI